MSLRNDVLYSIKWLAGARFAGQLVAWTVTLIVIRMLKPSDYGLMAMAEILIGFAALFREMGLYEAMIQKRDLTQRQIEQSFGILLLGNSLVYLLLFICAPWIAAFFGDPRLVDITRILGVQFPLAAVGVVQDAQLSRRMAFKRRSLVKLAVVITNSFTTLAFALSGAGVWALVYGSLAGAIVRPACLVLAAQYWCRPRFSHKDMGDMLRFSSFITASRIIWYVYSKADILLIGKLLGKEALGFYSVAMQLATLPMQKTAQILNQVGLAAYSSVQHDMAAIRSHYLKVIRVLSFIAFPVFWGISSISPELVTVVLGQRWAPAILPLQVLGLVMPIRMIVHGSGGPLVAIGKPHLGTLGQIFALLIMPPAFFIGAWYGGLLGASLAWVTGYPLLVMIRLRISLPALGLTYRDYFRSMTAAASGGIAMYVVVVVLRKTIVSSLLTPVLGLFFLIGAGAITYASFMWFLQQKDCRELLDLVQKRG